MFEKVLSKTTKESLDKLSQSKVLRKAYLAGGTALALQIGHRYSKDIDFFTPKSFRAAIKAQRIAEILKSFKAEEVEWRTIQGTLGAISFSLFYYEYPLLFKTHYFHGIQIADPRDIAAMKIAAIAARGSKKDFIDVYFLAAKEKIVTLQEALDLYDKKFKALQQNKIHILKGLAFFEDAEKEPLPKMIKDVKWREVKLFFRKEQKKLAIDVLQ